MSTTDVNDPSQTTPLVSTSAVAQAGWVPPAVAAEPAVSPIGGTPEPPSQNKEQLHLRVQSRLAELEAALAQLAGQDRNRKRVQAIETELQLARNSMSGGWKHVGQMEAAQLAQWLANTESLILTRGVEPTAPPS